MPYHTNVGVHVGPVPSRMYAHWRIWKRSATLALERTGRNQRAVLRARCYSCPRRVVVTTIKYSCVFWVWIGIFAKRRSAETALNASTENKTQTMIRLVLDAFARVLEG
jgi:hypothetical protein